MKGYNRSYIFFFSSMKLFYVKSNKDERDNGKANDEKRKKIIKR